MDMPARQDTIEEEERDSSFDMSTTNVVRSLLVRQGVQRRQYAVVVADVLGLSRSAAHNRINGNAGWLWDDVVRLAAHFNESLMDVVRGATGDYMSAQALIGKERFLVQVCLGDGPPDQGDAWGAFYSQGQLTVVLLAELGTGVQATKVLDVGFNQQHSTQLRVAVLDDSPDTAQSIADMLTAEGCKVTAHTAADALLADLALGLGRYDAYVLDWLLQNGTSEAVIAEIRRVEPQARIMLLTGEMGLDGKADSDEIANAQRQYKLLVCQKPITAAFLMSNLTFLDAGVHGALT